MKILVLCLLLPVFAHAATLEDVFRTNFVSGYRAGRCGDNIFKLVKAANSAGVDLSSASIVYVFNEADRGYDFAAIYGEYARAANRDGSPGTTRWNHHVALEDRGVIYDFDYGNTPVVVSAREWAQRQFLVSKMKPVPISSCKEPTANSCAFVRLIRATDYLADREAEEVSVSLKDWAASR